MQVSRVPFCDHTMTSRDHVVHGMSRDTGFPASFLSGCAIKKIRYHFMLQTHGVDPNIIDFHKILSNRISD